VLVLRGQGGIGKTSLAVKLMAACGIEPLTLAPSANCRYNNALFFKVGDSDGFDALAASFLTAFGLGASRDRSTTSAQKIDQILARLQQERWLVVIDNLESVMENDCGYAKSADVGELLNSLATVAHQSQIVITSRKFPDDLIDRRGGSVDIRVVADLLIPGISKEASIQLLQDLGARDSLADLEWIAGRVGGNVLILGWLAAYSRKQPGRLRKKPELVTAEAKPIVLAQWQSQSAPAQDLLQRMCVLRIAMDIPALTTLRLLQADGTAIDSTSEAEAETEGLLIELGKSDLVQELYDESLCESRFVLHPLMAETLQDIFAADLERLWKYAARLYGSINLPEDEIFRSMEDMRVVLEELHFYWLSGTDRESLVRIVINSILPNLRQWCYWDLTELWLNRILTVRTELGDRAGMAGCWGVLGNIASKRGDYDRAEALLNQCLAVLTELGYRAGMATYWGVLGDIARNQGDYDKAEALYNQALTVRTELGDRAGMASCWGSLGNIAHNRGDYDKAEALLNQCLAVKTELGDRAGMASSWGVLGDIASNRGDYDKAEALFNQSLAVRTELGDRAGMATSWGVLGDIARNRGDYDKAEALYNQCLAVKTELGDRAGMASSWGVLGDIARNRGDYDKAEDLYNQSLKVETELGNRAGMATSWGCLGETELGRGNIDAAETWLQKALTAMEDLQMTWHIAETNWDLAQLYRAQGDEPQAQQYYSIAHDLFIKLGAKGDLERIEKEWF
jgi:tetratricopeptide (TPR) repeat protein